MSGFFNTVLTLSISDAIVYMGGEFTSVNGEPRFCLAAVEAVTGDVTDWDPHPHDAVLTISLSGSNIYTGGRFFSIGGEQRNHLAAFDATTGMLTDWNPNVEGQVENPLGYAKGWIKKIGYFDPINPERSEFIDAGESLDPGIGTIAVSDSLVYVGGQFTSIGGIPRNNIAAINSTTGEVFENWDPNPDGGITKILIEYPFLFVSGNFMTIGNLERAFIAKLDLETGNPIEGWNANANFGVFDIAVSGSMVFTGGAFTSIGREDRNYIAALDLETGNAIQNWNPGTNSFVYSLAIDGSTLFVGGDFTVIGNESRSRIASVDAESGIVTHWDPNASGGGPPATFIYDLQVSGTTVYVAGDFTMIGQQQRNSIAALDKEIGLATLWDAQPRYPNSPVPQGQIYSISVSPSGSRVYAGGFFSEIRDKVHSYFATITADGVTVVSNSLVNGWQTLSVPVVVDDFTKTTVWPTANSVAYSYCNGYNQETILENGVGYYINFSSAQDIFYAGEFLEQFQTPVCAGWNIVGSISEEVPISTNVCLFPGPNSFTSSFFIYQNGYQVVTTIIPGMGHWIKVAMEGSLLVNIDPIQCDSESPESIEEDEMDHFIITDANGKKQDLYVANLDMHPSLGEMDLSMPPPLPEAGFDARFEEGEYVKPVSPDSGEVELVIDVETEAYPITLTWELNPENGITYSFIGDSGVGKISEIKSSSGNISFNQSRENKIRLLASADKINNSANLPTEYSLMQNYPNPFNPTTTIKYDLPKSGNVELVIYDILGREVTTLVNEKQQPGDFEVKWDATNVSSGIYFYQLRTTDFISTKKMILLK